MKRIGDFFPNNREMSGGPPHHHSHNRQTPASGGNTAWNRLQVPNYYPSRPPQHAHLQNEHSILPTWHTPTTTTTTTDPTLLKSHSHIFGLEQMLSSDRPFTRHGLTTSTSSSATTISSSSSSSSITTTPVVDLTLTTRNGQNGEYIQSPISLSVRDTNKINSLPASALDIEPIEVNKCTNNNSPGGGLVVGGLSGLKSSTTVTTNNSPLLIITSGDNNNKKRSSKRVDSILERLNPNLIDKTTIIHDDDDNNKSKIIIGPTSSHDENSNSSSLTTPSSNLRDDEVVSPFSNNEDSLDSNKSRRKRKPSKTVRLTKEEDIKQEDITTQFSPQQHLPPKIVLCEPVQQQQQQQQQQSLEVKQLQQHHQQQQQQQQNVETKEEIQKQLSPTKTQRTNSGDTETIDNIAAMVQEIKPVVDKCEDEKKPISVSVIKSKDNLNEQQQQINEIPKIELVTPSPPSQPQSSVSLTTTSSSSSTTKTTTTATTDSVHTTVITPAQKKSNSSFVEIENKLEEMFAGIEDNQKQQQQQQQQEQQQSSSSSSSSSTSSEQIGNNQNDSVIIVASSTSSSVSSASSTATDVASTSQVTSTSNETPPIKKSPKKAKRKNRNNNNNSRRNISSDTSITTPLNSESAPKNNKSKRSRTNVNNNNNNSNNNNNNNNSSGSNNSSCSKSDNKLSHKKTKKLTITNKQSKIESKDVYAYDSGSNTGSSKSRGPFIQIRGPRDSPLSVNVVNTPINDDDNDKKINKIKKYHDDSEYRHKVRTKGLHCSTLSNQYDAQTKDASWICAFCKRGPHAIELCGPTINTTILPSGDLFGPYFIKKNLIEFERRFNDPYDRQFKSKKVTKALDAKAAGSGFIVTTSPISRAQQQQIQQQQQQSIITSPPQSQPQQPPSSLPPPTPLSSPGTPTTLTNNSGQKNKNRKRKHSVCSESDDIYLGITPTNNDTFEIWAHEDCIVWSIGTYLVGPKIIGLEEAVWTCCNVICAKCHLKGANISCLKRGCLNVMHVCCARLTNWQFIDDNFKTYCPEHKQP